ncbi:MAG TPA: Calx-beta domain-containing protein [Chthoniobacterales bacterium]|nr:Calx-beta domain-containing protein [Chthoniobacterales bacterium]
MNDPRHPTANSSGARKLTARRALSFALLSGALCFLLLISSGAFAPPAGAQNGSAPAAVNGAEPADLAAFRQAVGGSITPLIVELKQQPAVLRKVAAEKVGEEMTLEDTTAYMQELLTAQDAFLGSLAQRGVRALLRETNVEQINGATRHIEYRFTYLLNGFVAYVATADIEQLRAQPEVAHVSEPAQAEFHLNKAIDYSLGTAPDPADRRTAVYGATKEFRPVDTGANPETPRAKIDGFEGQGQNIAIIDSGVDYRHPMFGGIGNLTPRPRVSGQPESATDNRKVIYFYAFSEPVGDPTDDFGHGTLVASCAAGFSVDGNTPARLGFGTGRDGTGIGPTTNGTMLIGTAPQARIMAYKVCGPAPQCPGDIELSIEDAASPVTLTGQGDGGSIRTMVSKPVADVINLSLGDTSGDPAGATSRSANNAALAGTIVVASAGNAGPGPGTIGAPSSATLAVSVAAGLDPGSVAGADVLATNQIPLEPCDDEMRAPGCDSGAQVAGPPEEQGASSNANLPEPGAPQGIRIFPVAGGGELPVERNPGDPTTNTGSVSAHYVFVERRSTAPALPPPVPASVANRIAIVKGSGTFASIANPVALNNPAAILIVTTVESATAVVVVGGIPTFTINPRDADALLDRLSNTDNDAGDPANGAVSRLPIRLADTISLPAYQGTMAGFSSRGPNDHPNARFRTIKPDITGPGVGVFGAATPEGLPDETIGLASLSGYTTANGTSFSGPVTAGAITLVRQRVREMLGLDTTDLRSADYRAKRFDTVTVARALLQNAATNLRNGLGQPQGDGASSVASVNDMGSGFVNVAGALSNNAIMVAPVDLLTRPREFTPAASPSPTPLRVLIPTASFGTVPVIGVNGTVVRTQEVIVRDVFNGAGSGVYNLSVQNSRGIETPGFQISFTSADGATPITSVSVPANGQASFRVRVAADGTQIGIDPTEFQWYVSANGPGGNLRMPFYYRAVRAIVPNITAPAQQELQGLDQPSPAPSPSGCAADSNGNYTVKFTYTPPRDGPNPVGFRIQEATRTAELFFDNANQALVAGANSRWSGSPQWTSNVNPATGSVAYYIPDTAEQNESLTMIGTVDVPPGGATLSFDTTQDTEQDFDFANVDVSGDGTNFSTVASFSGFFQGTRTIDISGFAGRKIKVRFRLTSDLVVSAPGWFVENIRVSSDDFRAVGQTGPAATSLDITGRFDGTYFYRVAGLFTNPIQGDPIVTGPYSNVRCVTVSGNPLPPPVPGVFQFNAATYAAGENAGTTTITVTRTGGTATQATVNFATSDGSATAGADYSPSSGTLTFAPGEASKTFTVAITDDSAVEPDETVNLTLSNPTGGASLGTPRTAVLTIIENDTSAGSPPARGTLQFSAASYSEAENAGNATITVTRTGGSDGSVSVAYATADGSAKTGSDYTSTPGTLMFGAGEVTKTFAVPLIDDSSPEPDESLTLTLSNVTGGATLGNPSTAALTILDTVRSGPPAQFLNISTRLRVQGGDNAGIGGFIITGSGDKRIIVRGIGPSLTADGQPFEGRLQNPLIELFNSEGLLVASNDNWKESPDRTEIESSGLAPQDDAEAAIARTLPPGAYTAIVFGKDQSEGIALVETYDRDLGGSSEMANISTRRRVETANNVLIGGFIAGARSGATNVIVRAIGPSLAGNGVPDALQDPIVELVNSNGETLDSSDDFRTSGDEAEVTARGLAPSDDRESAAFQTVAPGNYTVIVRGKNETTGVGLVEIYNVR